MSALFLIPVISLLYTSIESQSLGGLLGALGFLVVVLLMYFMGDGISEPISMKWIVY